MDSNTSANGSKDGNIPPHDKKDGDKKPPAVPDGKEPNKKKEEKPVHEENTKAKTTTNDAKAAQEPFTPSLLRSPSSASYSSNFVSIFCYIIK